MGIKFELRDRRKRQAIADQGIQTPEQEPDEESPLLGRAIANGEAPSYRDTLLADNR